MDRAGLDVRTLTLDGQRVIFEAVRSAKGCKELQRQSPERDRTTLYRAYNVVSQFEREGLTTINDEKAKAIAEAARFQVQAPARGGPLRVSLVADQCS